MQVDKILEGTGFREYGLPGYGVKLELGAMDFPYYLSNVFSLHSKDQKDLLRRFRENVRDFAFSYMKKWMMNRQQDLQKDLSNLFEFSESFDSAKFFQLIFEGKDEPADVYISVSNLRLRVKRFGDCLGLKLLANNRNSSEVHVDGTKTVEELTVERPGYVNQFLHHISCTIPLKKEHGENNSCILNLSQTFSDLEGICPGFAWSYDVPSVIKDYVKARDSKGVCIGVFAAKEVRLCIKAKIIHANPYDLTNDCTWREGNVGDFKPGIYRFKNGDGLCLQLEISSNLPNNTFMRDIDVNLEVSEEQGWLRNVGAALYLQLCAQEMLKR